MFKKLSITLFILPFVVINTACSNTLNKTDHPLFTKVGEVTKKRLSEMSGIAQSNRNPNIFWVHNDSGHKAEIYAVNKQGRLLGTVKLKGIKNKDWEDISAFKYKGKPYLLIADVGDNRAKRKKVTLHIIKEPKSKKLSADNKLKIKPESTINFVYEGGARDVESVAIDQTNNKIIILSKRNQPPVLYSLPLNLSNNSSKKVAKRLTEVNAFIPANPTDPRSFARVIYDAQPTAMDIAQDGKSAIVLTYLRAYFFKNAKANSATELLTTQPTIIELPFLEQTEAISLSHDGKRAYITSEKVPTPILELDLSGL